MIEFTFTHKTLGPWVTVITLSKDMTGSEAFDEAAHQYKALVFPNYVPGHKDVTVSMRGV